MYNESLRIFSCSVLMEIGKLFLELAEPESGTGNARNNGACKEQKQ